ncbi:MAG TPA: DUF4011 domain-containing protein, partial [Kofleriaceae bacterium]|nr:DUF4011 domain-containing protein [Kofleriaceae bacterium]
MIDPAAQARLERWKRSLLDLTAGNRLLDVDVKRGRTMVPLPSADPVRIAAALADGDALVLVADSAPEGARHLVASLSEQELARRLVAIRRAARAQLADGGVHTLWLGLGMLTWCAAVDDVASGELETRRAP